MKIDFQGVTAPVPDGWINCSTLVFAMPADDQLRSPLALQKQVAGSAANLVLTWDERTADPRALLDQKVAELTRQIPGIDVLSTGEVAGTDASIPFAELAVPGKVAVRQIVFVRRIGGQTVTITGTAVATLFDKLRASFVASATGLAVGTR